MKKSLTVVGLAAATLALTACNGGASESGAAASPADQWFAALAQRCGKAFAGKLVSDDAVDADFAKADMVMHVKKCSKDAIAIPFHVQLGEGAERKWDRSRTWLITREGARLRLKHDHRHEDGTSDAVTMYGGDTVEAGTERAQHFIVDPESITLFEEQDLPASVTNVWSVEIDGADADTPDLCLSAQTHRRRRRG